MAQQDAPKPAPQPAPAVNPFDTMQSMLNLIFLQSGRFIKEHQSGGGTGRMKFAMQRAVPVANERFLDSLDELENEIRLAQTVLRRDLALLKQDRKKREAAAKQQEAEQARLAAESKNAPPPKPDAPKEEHATPNVNEAPAQDVQPDKDNAADDTLKREEEPVPPPPIETSTDDAPRDPLFDGTPTTANPQESEFDFDAMFGDPMDMTTNDQDAMDTTGDMDINFDEDPSLLRGLEDFAKMEGDSMGQDATTMDLDFPIDLADLNPPTTAPSSSAPATSTATTTAPATTATTTAPTAPPPAVPAETAAPAPAPTEEPKPAPAEEKVDDMEMLETMATDNLDDLFNLDYQDVENSQFDDAFFNFGD